MSEITKCPKCNGEYVYFDGALYVCPDCGHEFNEEDEQALVALADLAISGILEISSVAFSVVALAEALQGERMLLCAERTFRHVLT